MQSKILAKRGQPGFREYDTHLMGFHRTLKYYSKRQISRRTHKGPRRTAAKDADRAKKQKLSTIRREKILLAQSVAMTTGRGPKENRIVPEHDRLMNFVESSLFVSSHENWLLSQVDNIKSIIALEESGVELSPLRSNAMVSWQPPRSIDSALAHKDVTTSVMEQNSANNDGLRVAIRKVILIHLAKGPMSITLDDRIPPLPTGFFQRDIDLLNTMWDDHDPQWKGSSPLVLSGDLDGVPATLPIALIYWQEIYKNYGSGRWASSGQSWRNYEVNTMCSPRSSYSQTARRAWSRNIVFSAKGLFGRSILTTTVPVSQLGASLTLNKQSVQVHKNC